MLRAYSTNITATANQPIVFSTDKLDTDSSIVHTSNSGNIIVRNPGYYEVNFDISATMTEASENPLTIQLYANGVAIPDAIITQTITANAYSNMSFDTIIKANVGMMGQSVTLTIVPSEDITIADTSVGVNRLQLQ